VTSKPAAARTARRSTLGPVGPAQIQDHYAQTEREAQSEVSRGEQQAVEERETAEREAEDQSCGTGGQFHQGSFNALTRVIGAIFDAVRAGSTGSWTR